MKIGSTPASAMSQTFSGWCAIRTVPMTLMPRHIAIAKGTAVPVVISSLKSGYYKRNSSWRRRVFY